ncbi:rhodanese-like domain-containing protein [Austwickia chelonae]|uniref:rhodanese-like domain-containing protein n=1 Tax=Austwickia chelonae TaxID=100225 RepID=UPI00058B32F1|nr:rhodanese-like domain-containing protein [Austwickia chelonae]
MSTPTPTAVFPPIVDISWLSSHLGDDDLVLLDASIRPNDPRGQRIPGARRFDLENDFSAADSVLPHSMPDPEAFAEQARRLGIGTESTVIVYDVHELYSAARAWWMFHAMGHTRVAVLDGGMNAWIAAGHDLEPIPDEQDVPEGNFTARPRPGAVVDADTVAVLLHDPACAVVDARSHGRFTGTDPEPRPGLRSGHMPGATNLPYLTVQEDGRLRPADELRTLIDEATEGHPNVAFSCGSGVTACVTALAACVAGYDPELLSVYDGSWTEWGDPNHGRPVVTGPEKGEAAPLE